MPERVPSLAEKAKNNVVNDVFSLREQLLFARIRELKLLSKAPGASAQKASATAELRQAGDRISTKSKKLTKLAQSETFTKSLADNVAFHAAKKEDLKKELALQIVRSTRLGQLFYDLRAEVFPFRESLGTKNPVIGSVVEDLYASLGLSPKCLVEEFLSSPNSIASEAFCADTYGSQYHADDAVDGITVRLSEGTALNDTNGSTKSEDVY